MSSSSTTGAIFGGNSRYAADFSTVLERAVAIASLPKKQLEAGKTALEDQSSAVSALETRFSALSAAIDNIEAAAAGSSFDTIVSDKDVLRATVGDGAMEGVYSVEVLDVGAYASSMTSAAWNAPAGHVTYQLKVGSQTWNIEAANNAAASVAARVNAVAGDKVRATVVNVGGPDSPDYRIALQSTRLGDYALELRKDGADLQTAQATGREARYVVNDSGVTVSSRTRNVPIAAGLTVDLLASAPGSAVDITLTRSSAAVSDALSAFATAYNETLDAVDEHRGEAGGALSGQALVYRMSEVLRSIATYSSGDSISGPDGLGLSLGRDGKLAFNPFSFIAADLTNSAGITSFLGSSATGGFLRLAAQELEAIDGGGGLVQSFTASIESRRAALDSSIARETASIETLQERLFAQMAAADALIARMEQQYNYLANMFSAMDTASRSYR